MINSFFNNCIWKDGFVDELNDGQWSHEINEECKHIAQNDPDLVLPVIGYIDKTGTDVNERDKLEPFSFTLKYYIADAEKEQMHGGTWFHAWPAA